MSDPYTQAPHPALTEAQIDIAVLKSELHGVKRELAEMRIDTSTSGTGVITLGKWFEATF